MLKVEIRLVCVFLVLAACQSAAKQENTLPAVNPQDLELAKNKKSIDTLELKQAEIFNKFQEINQELRWQREKIELLQRTLQLGIDPRKSEIKSSELATPEKSVEANRPIVHEDKIAADAQIVKTLNPQVAENSKDVADDSQEGQLALARSLFDQGRFSKAYVAFSKIEKENHLKDNEGLAKFWMGRCWLELNEYQNAQAEFKEFIVTYPQSGLLAPAKFYLARTDIALGLREQATKELQGLITSHPYEVSAEEAKVLLKGLAKTL